MAVTGENKSQSIPLSDVELLSGTRVAVEKLPSQDMLVKELPDVQEPSLPMIGFYLSKFVLYIIAGFIVVFLIFFFVQENKNAGNVSFSNAATVSDTAFSRRLELLRLSQEEVKANRAHTLQIAQMILLNLLLPVLTAILGYIFGSSRARE